MISKLLFSGLRHDKVRVFTALFGISASAALLTWTLGLAVTTYQQGRKKTEQMGQPYDCWIATGRAGGAAPKGTGIQKLTPGSPVKTIPEEVQNAVLAWQGLEFAQPTMVYRCGIDYRPNGRAPMGPGFGAGMADVQAFPECPYREGLSIGRWPNANAAEPEFAVLESAFGDEPKPELNTKMTLVSIEGKVEAKLVGYLSPEIRPTSGFPTLFISQPLTTSGANLILCKLKPGANEKELEEITNKASPDDDSAHLVTREALLTQFRSDAINSLSRQVPLLTILACVAAACMLTNAVCIGIAQRHQLFVRLRAIGMTSFQLKKLIIGESLFLSGLGWVLGFSIGVGLLATYVLPKPDLFPDGLFIGASVTFSSAALFLATTLFGLIFPLKRLTAVRPAEAFSSPLPMSQTNQIRRGLLGILLMLPVLIAVIPYPVSPMLRSCFLVIFGIPLHVLGVCMALPLIITGIEKLLSRPLAKILFLHPLLLRGSITRDSHRTARMAVTLTAGLGAFMAIHIWGSSMTAPFIPTANLPDAIISCMPNGINSKAIDEIRKIDSIKRVIPFTASQYVVHNDDITNFETFAHKKTAQNNILLIGVDTEKLFGKKGIYATEMFHRQTGYGIGKTVRLQQKEPNGNVKTLDCKISDIVNVNWHLVTARSRLRGRNGAPFGTLGPLFVPIEITQKWNPEETKNLQFVWFDFKEKLTNDELYSAGDKVENFVQKLAEKPEFQAEGNPFKNRIPAMKNNMSLPRKMTTSIAKIQVHLRDEISDGTISRATDLVGELAQIPFWSLTILSFGFISMLTATIRAMQRELATMRAVGLTEGQFARLLLAQVFMTLCVAIIFSLIFGFCVGWAFTGWTHAWMTFQGLPVSLNIPWFMLLRGILLTVACAAVIAPLPIYFIVKKMSLTHNSD